MNALLRQHLSFLMRFALIGAFVCMLAGLTSDALFRFLQLPPREGIARDPFVVAMLVDSSSGLAEATTGIRAVVNDAIAGPHEYREITFSGSTAGNNMTWAFEEAEKLINDRNSTRNAVILLSNSMPFNLMETLRRVNTLRNKGAFIVTVGTRTVDNDFFHILSSGGAEGSVTAFTEDFTEASEKVASILSSSTVNVPLVSRGLVTTVIAILLLSGGLLAADNVMSMRGPWARDLWWIPVVALVFGITIGSLSSNLVQFWALAGLSCGIALVLTNVLGSFLQKDFAGAINGIWRGAFFGLAGGVFGAFLVGLLLNISGGLGWESNWNLLIFRTTSLAIVGFCVALSIKLGEEWFKEAWLLGTAQGQNRNKKYALRKRIVTIGRASKNDVSLQRAKGILDHAGRFTRSGSDWFFQPAASQRGASVTINNQAVSTRTRLADRNLLRLGETTLVFRCKVNSNGFDYKYLALGMILLLSIALIVGFSSLGDWTDGAFDLLRSEHVTTNITVNDLMAQPLRNLR